jgi:hypothetical protein
MVLIDWIDDGIDNPFSIPKGCCKVSERIWSGGSDVVDLERFCEW